MKSLLLFVALLLSSTSFSQTYRVRAVHGKDTVTSNHSTVPRIQMPFIFQPNHADSTGYFTPVCHNLDSVRVQIFSTDGHHIHSMLCGDSWSGLGKKTTYSVMFFWYDKRTDQYYYENQTLIENPVVEPVLSE